MKADRSLEIFPLLELYESGQLTKTELCRQAKLKKGGVYYWMQRYRQSGGRTRQSGFVQLTMPEFQQSAESTYWMEVDMGDGRRIRFTSMVPVDYLEAILKHR